MPVKRPTEIRAIIHYLCSMEYTGQPCTDRRKFGSEINRYIERYKLRLQEERENDQSRKNQMA